LLYLAPFQRYSAFYIWLGFPYLRQFLSGFVGKRTPYHFPIFTANELILTISEEVVEAPSVDSFKRRLDKYMESGRYEQ
jgi:hypothetical protein